MAKKSKRSRTQSAKQSLGTSSYIFEGLVAMARTLVNAKKEWGVEKMNEFADATEEYAKSFEDIPTLGSYASAMAAALKDLADYVNETEFDQILKDSSNFAKRHPVPMIIGGAIAGLAVTQILRSREFGFTTRHSGKTARRSTPAKRGRTAATARHRRRVNGQAHLNA
jgi:hypothetical protein